MGSPEQNDRGGISVHLLMAGQVIRAYKISSSTAIIGSGRACAITVAGDPSIAPKHATILLRDGVLTLIAEPGARVLVDDEPVDIAVLSKDSLVRIGRFTFQAETAGEALTPEATAPPSQDAAEATAPPFQDAAEATAPPSQDAAETAPTPEPVPPEKVTGEDTGGALDPTWYLDNEEDEELTFVEPFDLAEDLLAEASCQTPEKAGVSLAAQVVRVFDGRVSRVARVDSGHSYEAAEGGLLCEVGEDSVSLFLEPGSEARVFHREETTSVGGDAPVELELRRGEWARVSLAGLCVTYRIDAVQPVAPPRQRLARIGIQFPLVAMLALSVHVVLAMVRMNPVVEIEDEDGKTETFVVMKVDKTPPPKEPKKVEPPPPPDATHMAEKGADVSTTLVSRTMQTLRSRPAAKDVDSLLKVLSKGSGTPGASDNLKDLISNIDAVAPSSGGGSSFKIAGAIASLPGGEINVARKGGGGVISTLDGSDVAGKNPGVARLGDANRKGVVRGKVTKMSSGMKVHGRLARSEVTRVVNSHLHKVQACYERALLSNPGLSGRIGFEWTVETDGVVSGVRVKSSTLGSARVADCISALIKKWGFPKPDGGEVIITYPFLFRTL